MSARADYGGRLEGPTGGRLASVAPGSPAARAGLARGDRVVSADGNPLADVLDWQWFTDGDEVVLEAERAGEPLSVALTRSSGEAWGVEFEAALFDGVRTCRNACAFCFMTQLPRGLRPALYLRDDDYRLSFLQGNFISLTNLSDADVDRIVEQRLSPLYFSLHAVAPEVRTMLVCAQADSALERADELLGGGIELHVQIVLVPGINDRDQLEGTLTWCAEREGIVSVGVVPLGYTGHQTAFDHSYDRPEDAAKVIDQVIPWHDAMRDAHGTGWVYLADEFYLAAGRLLPPAADYDDFPQYENGIGLARSFVDALGAQSSTLAKVSGRLAESRSPVVVVTGRLFAPVVDTVLSPRGPRGLLTSSAVRVLSVGNRFFGGNVSVAGLLTAEDVVGAIRADAGARVTAGGNRPTTYLVPDVVLNADGLTLDDVAGTELSARSGQHVRLVSSNARGLVEALSALANPSR